MQGADFIAAMPGTGERYCVCFREFLVMLLFSKITRHRLCAPLLAAAIVSAPLTAQAQAPAARYVVKNLRDIEPNSVRFAAIQGSRPSPTVVLFGGSKSIWPKIKGAVEQSEANGYPVRAILIGPDNAPPALEIYATGHHVTNPINPYVISQAELVKLLRDVSREYYRR